MERIETTLVCDYCTKAEGDGVETRAFTLEGKAREVEACERCWTRVSSALLKKARTVKRKR